MGRPYTSGKIDQVQLDDLKQSERAIGQIYPVLKNAQGGIIDGFHRKRSNPDWKEATLPINAGLETLKLRAHLNLMRRDIPREEKQEWVSEARKLLQQQGKKGTQKEIAEALRMSREWVEKYNPTPRPRERENDTPYHFYGYNVWGFKDESWRKLILEADPNQPWPQGYHGATPAFVIHQLIKMVQPKRVLDSMAGVGTTAYVCKQYGIPCDQYDLYPFPKYGVQQQDAEAINGSGTYDLIFNHVPYLSMVKYGDNPEDLSRMDDAKFYHKMKRIFERNLELLAEAGIYAILVGDWRRGGELVPLTAKVALMGIEAGFTLYDMAIKLTGEMKSKELQEYRAAKFGYLAQTYDTVLIFRKSD
jgi:hypothetical protein